MNIMKTTKAPKAALCLAILVLATLGGVAYHIVAAGGGTPNSTDSNRRQPFANGNGLVAWYPLDGDTKDYSGNNNDGTATNFTYDGSTNGWTNGKFGKALLFNGTSNYVSFQNPVTLTGAYTVALWWKTNTNSGTQTAISDEVTGSNTKIGIAAGRMFIRIISGGSSDNSVPLLQLSTGNWHHLVLTRDSSDKATFWIDGLCGCPLYSKAPQSGSVSYQGIGFSDTGNGEYFNGAIDDVRIYNRDLSQSEIMRLAGGSQPASCDQSCKAYYKFDDSASTAKDSTSAGLNGTLHNFNFSATSQWTSGNFAGGLLFDGIDDYVSLPNLGLTSGTVDLWIKPTSTSGDQRLFTQLTGLSTQAGQLALNQSSGESGSLWVWDGSAWQRLSADGSVQAGKWNQIVVTNNGGNATAYINGARQLNTAAGFDFGGVTVGIGAKFLGTTGGTLNGAIDDFRIYSRMLAPEEVADQWRQGT